MEHDVLKQRYKALEAATESRLGTFNNLIREERNRKSCDKEKIDYLKIKKRAVFQELNYIRECLKKNDLNEVSYDNIKKTYLNFQTSY